MLRALTIAGIAACLLGFAACGSGESSGESDGASEKETRGKEPPGRQAKGSSQRPEGRREDAGRRRERALRRGGGGRAEEPSEPQRGEAARRLRERQQALEEHQEQAPQERCHPSYDPCLDPNVSDYDCAGSGDGPGYAGPVTVKGEDAYDLDADGDGKACAP